MKKKDRIILVDFRHDTFYISSMHFEKGDSVVIYDYIIEIEEYKLTGNLLADEIFIKEIKDVIAYYQKFSEETLLNVSRKLGEVKNKKFLLNEIESSIEYYYRTRTIDNIKSKDFASKIFSYIKNNMDFIVGEINNSGYHPNILYEIVDKLLSVSLYISMPLTMFSGFALTDPGSRNVYSFSGTIGGCVLMFLLMNLGDKFRNIEALKTLNRFLETLQNKFSLTDDDYKLSGNSLDLKQLLVKEDISNDCLNALGLIGDKHEKEYSETRPVDGEIRTATLESGPELTFPQYKF